MKPLGSDPQHVKGMSDKLIVSHYQNNYGSAVKRLNLIAHQLSEREVPKLEKRSAALRESADH